MTTAIEAFQNIVGINFADAVLNELRCARKAVDELDNEDNKEIIKHINHIAAHLDAAGALSYFMKSYYGDKATAEKEIHEEAMKEYKASNLLKMMAEILQVGNETSDKDVEEVSDEALSQLLKALGL